MADYKRFDVKVTDGVCVIRPVDKELSDLVLQDELQDELMKFLAEALA